MKKKEVVLEKVNCKTEWEFINCIADRCYSNFTQDDKEYIKENPKVIDYHFSYCLYIRNNHIYNKDFSDVNFFTEPDHLSYRIMQVLVSKVLPEYDPDNLFICTLYDDDDFLSLRKQFKEKYGEYPVDIVMKYRQKIVMEPSSSALDCLDCDAEDIDQEIEAMKRNYEKSREEVERLLEELKKLV